MKGNMFRKSLVISIIILFIGVYVLKLGAVENNNQIDFQIRDNPELNNDNDSSDLSDNLKVKNPKFELPKWGGAMVHSDSHQSDYINLPVPTTNVKMVWHKNQKYGERFGTRGNGIAGNGEIAACSFGFPLARDNLIIYDYEGTRKWESDGLLNGFAMFSTPMVDKHNRIIACDNKKILMIDLDDVDSDGNSANPEKHIDWITDLPPLHGVPFSPTITENGVIILPISGGVLPRYGACIYSFDIDGQFLDCIKFDGYGNFNMNSACVDENRVYVLVVHNPLPISQSRLYAIDVDADGTLTIVWYYEFDGMSQATPLFIDGTLYFDSCIEIMPDKNPHIIAIDDNGSNCNVKWVKSLSSSYNRTWFSFAYDPRGGFWYLDPKGKKIVRFSTENGNPIEEILIADIVQEPWPINTKYKPSSCITICESDTNLIAIVSARVAYDFLNLYNNYVLAINLSDNSLLWQVEVDESEDSGNFANGQYTILMDEYGKNHRIVFGTRCHGVMAIGTNDL